MSSHHHENEPCLLELIKKINEVQSSTNKVDKDISCEKSIQQLISPFTHKSFNTIPILLVCKGECEYFIGSGIFKNSDSQAFDCFRTPTFRINKIVNDRKRCVELELLQPQPERGVLPASNDIGICRFFPEGKIKKFIRTGVCITLDLNCFCGIECLPPVKADKGTPVTQPSSFKIFQEELCGNVSPSTPPHEVWFVEESVQDYIQGTFEIFNADPSNAITATVKKASGINVFLNVPPSSSAAVSVNQPIAFEVNSSGTQAVGSKFCITLYKQL